ncbi:unnamed protein product [Caenorhabditis sp. 36 PRJEB53466]|nr:unnamed protein product [Caenorhabditis sp. 36 PRJEB53466]
MDSDEVRKRKEYAERKVKERHAALRKEAEERRKHTVEHRERVQSQLKREQVLLQKRMQQLNEDEERKKATLAKQHEATSRIAAITKSPKSFAFGSSTPRTLTYLDKLPKSEQQYDKKLRPLDGGSPITTPTATSPTAKIHRVLPTTPQRAPPAAHRPAPTMTSMTSSMYVTSSAPPTRHAKMIAKPAVSATSKRLSQGPTSMMTQSVYTPTSRPATSSRLSMGRTNRGATPNSSRPNVTSTPPVAAGRRSMDVKKPPMPRKSMPSKMETKKFVAEAPAATVSTVPVETAQIVEEAATEQPVVASIAEESPSPVHEDSPVEEKQVAERADSESTEVLVKIEETQKEIEETQLIPDVPLIEISEPVHQTIEELVQQEEKKIIIPEEAVEEISEAAILEEVLEQKEEEVIMPSALSVGEHHEEPVVVTEEVRKEEVKETEVEGAAPNEELISLANDETSESQVGSSVNTSLTDELIELESEQNRSHDDPSKREVLELHYPMPDESKVTPPVAANDLVDVFGNDFINENPPQRNMNFDEETDSGKASPTSSETSSTTDDVTPRSTIDEVKAAAPRVLPLVRSAEDIARKEREARETEERRNRLAEILAKTRGMASPVTNALPPTTATINKSGGAIDVLARVAAKTNLPSLQKILQRKQGSNPSLQTSESNGGEIY